MEEVASSRMRIEGFRMMARAKETQLFLALGERAAAIFEDGVVAFWLGHDEVIDADEFGRCDDLFVRGVQFAIADVVLVGLPEKTKGVCWT
jgi:hypothetical protein